MSLAFSGPIVEGGKGREYSELEEIASAGSLQFHGLGDELPFSHSIAISSIHCNLHLQPGKHRFSWEGLESPLLGGVQVCSYPCCRALDTADLKDVVWVSEVPRDFTALIWELNLYTLHNFFSPMPKLYKCLCKVSIKHALKSHVYSHALK